MIGAMCGDFAGSVYEFSPTKDFNFELGASGSIWTDDSAMTMAVANAVLENRTDPQFERHLVEVVLRHPWAGYGPAFREWAFNENRGQQDSWGNGSAMRVSSIPWLASRMAETASLACKSALPSHSHHHGIRGALATAVMGRAFLEGAGVDEARALIEGLYGYDLSRTPDQIRPGYSFEVKSHGSVPEAMCCALTANSWEEAVRSAVSLGGDADTQAAIAGGIAAARFGEASIPQGLLAQMMETLPDDFRDTLTRFDAARAKTDLGRSDWKALERWHQADFAMHPADDKGVAGLAAMEALQSSLMGGAGGKATGGTARGFGAWLHRLLGR